MACALRSRPQPRLGACPRPPRFPAEALYRQFREGKAGGRGFHKGLVVGTGLGAWKSWLQVMPARWRIRGSLMALLPCLIGAAALMDPTPTGLGAFGAACAAAMAAIAWWLEAQIARPLEQVLEQVLEQALRVASGERSKAVQLARIDESA